MKNVFANRNYRLVFFGILVSEVGALLYNFAVSFYILEISGNNAFLQGLYLAVCGAMVLVMMPIGGVLGDRFNKAGIMVICDFIKGGIILAATVLMLVFRSSAAHLIFLFIIGFLGNAVSGIFSPAAGALLPHIVEEKQLQQANSYFSIRSSIQGIAGVVLAGVFYSALDIYTLFFIVGACYVVSGISEIFIRYDYAVPEERLTVKLAVQDLKTGFVYLKAQKVLMAFMVAILFINFFITPVVGNFIPYFIKTDVGNANGYLLDKLIAPEFWLSVLQVLIGVGSLAAAAVLSAKPQADKCGRKITRMIAVMAVLMMGVTAAYWILVHKGTSLNGFLIVLSAGSLLFGISVTNVNIPANTAIMRIVDRNMLSKVSSLLSVASQGLIPIASVLAGVILQGLGSAALLAFCAVGFAAATLLLLTNPHVDEL
ncbi:MAG: MFS transporter [Clostridia bacterium]|nr:MFS transporter [Clostridia bacterium]